MRYRYFFAPLGILALLAFLVLTPRAARAQTALPVSSYTLLAIGGTYTELATTPVTRSLGSADDGAYNGLPLNFTFVFRGQSYTSVSASTNGWLTFGQDIANPGFANNLATGGNGLRPLVAPLWADLSLALGNFYYATTGTPPYRVFTAEWRQVKWSFNAPTPVISFQVQLFETTNRVQLVYRQETGAVNTVAGAGASIGLAGPDGDFLSLNSTGPAPAASYSTSTNDLVAKPATGQTYAFNPPARSNLAFAARLQESDAGTYQEVAGAPATRSAGFADDGLYNGLPLGFPFVLRGQAYTTVSASTNGWLTFGQNIASTGTGITDNLSSTIGAPRPLLAPLWDDLDLTGGGFYYATTGTAPNRVFTAEWRNARWEYNAAAAAISFQVRLFESSGRIWFVYRPEAGSVRNGSASIGLSDTDGYFLSLNGTGPAPTASSTTATDNLNTKPALNQIYAFAPEGTPSGPLPVELTAFTATVAGPAAVRLAWSTASEKDSHAFGVERSLDGRTFAVLSMVAAAGSSNTTRRYQWVDAQLPASAALLYYRLQQVDTDGTVSYSPVRAVARSSPSALVLFPNPTRWMATLTGAPPPGRQYTSMIPWATRC
ncbi:hypothetical protein GO988_20775 [Hymenobacter sp. HMF4947]|uniref:Uncharacterized protein n=1 Tax=Hymenobacter ginkgonis TaxID=2682976 RepID=A0A7K1TK47_9BACT|nr:hypothetical protein [Hymenobacter ginkgonis]MVN78775.1 hypothetical protein [Hymenobacter ginkgonis]